MSVFHNWLLEIACENYFVYIKRLSANDTGATGGHQVGLYIPSGIVEKLFPSINHTRELNPSVFLTAHVSSHDCPDSEARAIYYNSRHFGKKQKRTWYQMRPISVRDKRAMWLAGFSVIISIILIVVNGGRLWNPFR